MHSTLCLAFGALFHVVLAVNPLVSLNYTTYEGTALSNGVTQWLGVRYAAPPLGNLRFQAPQDPLAYAGIQTADEHGPVCLGTMAGPPTSTMQEDCLFMDIYAPSNTSYSSQLPVYFFIQGGGFNTNSNANYNGSGLVTASGMNIVVVNFNYRVGPYGFLASEEVAQGGSINNGLKDQRKALSWVQRYISQFGGDPSRVTLAGDSAGAASVNLQLTAYGGRDDGLFRNSAAESQSFAALRTVASSQYQYDNLVIRTNCDTSNQTLACLRSLNATFLQEQNINTPFPGAQNPPLYMYGPVLDYDFVTDYTYAAYTKGNFVKLPAIYGDDTNEGTIFTPQSTSTIGESDTFIQDQFPDITLEQLDVWNSLYPVNGTAQFPGTGEYWRQVSNGYGEMRYICPGIYISNVYASMNISHSYNYHWNVLDPTLVAEGYGVPHTIETNAIWGPDNTNGGAPSSYYPGGSNAAIVAVTQAYWTSFIRSSDPNTYRLPGSPLWQQWTATTPYQRLRFQTNNTHMETVPKGQQDRCAYLSSIGLDLKQ